MLSDLLVWGTQMGSSLFTYYDLYVIIEKKMTIMNFICPAFMNLIACAMYGRLWRGA